MSPAIAVPLIASEGVSNVRNQSRGAAIAIGVALAAALVAVGGLALSPAQAQQVSEAMVQMMAVVSCNSFNACAGGRNSNAGFGVIATSAKGNGLDASTKNPSKTHPGRSGVYGHDDSTDGGSLNVGVAGSSPNGSGVQGSSVNGYGIQASSVNGLGVLGASTSGVGVWGSSQNSIALYGYQTPGDGVLGFEPALELQTGTADQSGTAVFVSNSLNSPIFEVDNAGNVFILGKMYTSGTCQQGCSKTRHVSEYTPRESEPTIEDIGEGRLVAGKAYVALDPAYANVINRGASYVVFVSAEGPNQGLYVTQKTSRGFEVMENPGGHSSIPFGYRIVAKPYGETAPRLPMRAQTRTPKVNRP